MKRILSIIVLLTVCGYAFGQPITRVVTEANHPLRHRGSRIRTDTDNFDGTLDSTDDTVQKALDSLDDSASATAWPAGCGASPATHDFCFYYDANNTVMILWVDGSQEAQWPETITISYIQLESGENPHETGVILIESQAGVDKVQLE